MAAAAARTGLERSEDVLARSKGVAGPRVGSYPRRAGGGSEKHSRAARPCSVERRGGIHSFIALASDHYVKFDNTARVVTVD